MTKDYVEAISEYNLKELKRSLSMWNDDSLAEILSIDVLQARLLKRLISQANNKEE